MTSRDVHAAHSVDRPGRISWNIGCSETDRRCSYRDRQAGGRGQSAECGCTEAPSRRRSRNPHAVAAASRAHRSPGPHAANFARWTLLAVCGLWPSDRGEVARISALRSAFESRAASPAPMLTTITVNPPTCMTFSWRTQHGAPRGSRDVLSLNAGPYSDLAPLPAPRAYTSRADSDRARYDRAFDGVLAEAAQTRCLVSEVDRARPSTGAMGS